MKQIKSIAACVMKAISGCMMPLIPVLVGGAMLKTILAVFGPQVLGWIPEDSGLAYLLTFVADAAFYFLPVYACWSSARYFDTNRGVAMFLGGLLLHPSFAAVQGEELSLGIIGIPTLNYAGSILPAILSVWVFSYVWKWLEKVIPEMLGMVFVPFLAMLVMVPLVLCVIGPAGNWLGTWLIAAVLWLGGSGMIGLVLTAMLIGALWQFIVMCGMHWLFIASVVAMNAAGQADPLIFPAAVCSSFSIGGICLGIFLSTKGKEKSDALGFMVSQMLGGVTEPGLYGEAFRTRSAMAGMMAGGAAGALYMALMHVHTINLVPVANFLVFLGYTGGSVWNVIHCVIGAAIAFAAAAVVTMVLQKRMTKIEKGQNERG